MAKHDHLATWHGRTPQATRSLHPDNGSLHQREGIECNEDALRRTSSSWIDSSSNQLLSAERADAAPTWSSGQRMGRLPRPWRGRVAK